jgi:phenylalanyl-tRNA synthetase beta chain
MKASYRWLRALVPGLSASPRELAERFTSAGLEVEALEEYGAGTDQVVVAQVRKVEPHPSRDKLRLVTVDRGGAEQRVVCGAPNVPEPGGLVAFAPLGSHLPAVDMTLAPRDIGGVRSEGMLCSEIELGLVGGGGADPGIIVLARDLAKPGTPLRQAAPAVSDWVLDIGVTPNRPDALGHVGLAGVAAALFDLPFGYPSPVAPSRIAQGNIDKLAQVTIEDTERCATYGAAAVVDVRIGPSPDWVRYRLESLGIRGISNVVDVTNLVLLEFGHPMHAFDLELVRGARIIVRRARASETLTTLDGQQRKLDQDDLVIADAEGAVALAGVMGGASSEIRPQTKRVLLECAYFAPRGIRRSARRHGMHTESSHRFERGVDPSAIPDVLAHAASLLTELAGGSAVPGSIMEGPGVPRPAPIPLRSARMNALLGVEVPMAEATATLVRLGCALQGGTDGGAVQVVPPTHRPDLRLEADLIEEVVRVRGLESIPAVLPAIKPQTPRDTGVLIGKVRRAAIELGLSEAITYGFVSPKELAALGMPRATVTLKNPLGDERSVMRNSLLPGLLEAAVRARRHGAQNVRLFTVGPRFLASRGDTIAESPRAKRPPTHAPLPDEVPSFAAVIAGTRRGRLTKPEEVDVYDAKGVAIELVERVTGRGAEARAQRPDARLMYLHPRGAADLVIEGLVVGAFGPLHPDVADALDVEGPCVIVEADLRALERLGISTPRFSPIPALPAATRDIAVVVHDDVTAGAVAEAIRDAARELCESVELFDLFRGGSVPADHRSLAYHVIYRDPKAATEPEKARTLTDDEVDARHKAVVDAVTKRFGATLRA